MQVYIPVSNLPCGKHIASLCLRLDCFEAIVLIWTSRRALFKPLILIKSNVKELEAFVKATTVILDAVIVHQYSRAEDTNKSNTLKFLRAWAWKREHRY